MLFDNSAYLGARGYGVIYIGTSETHAPIARRRTHYVLLCQHIFSTRGNHLRTVVALGTVKGT